MLLPISIIQCVEVWGIEGEAKSIIPPLVPKVTPTATPTPAPPTLEEVVIGLATQIGRFEVAIQLANGRVQLAERALAEAKKELKELELRKVRLERMLTVKAAEMKFRNADKPEGK